MHLFSFHSNPCFLTYIYGIGYQHFDIWTIYISTVMVLLDHRNLVHDDTNGNIRDEYYNKRYKSCSRCPKAFRLGCLVAQIFHTYTVGFCAIHGIINACVIFALIFRHIQIRGTGIDRIR